MTNQTETSDGNIIHRNIIYRTIFLYSYSFHILIVSYTFFLQNGGDWSLARTYSTFMISHHTNPAYTLVYSNEKKYRYHRFADKDRAGKCYFNTDKNDSYTENMIN